MSLLIQMHLLVLVNTFNIFFLTIVQFFFFHLALGLELPNVRAGQPLLKFHLAPLVSQGFDVTDVIPVLDRINLVTTLSQEVGWQSLCDKLQAVRSSLPPPSHIPLDPAFELVFLGTGAALPSKYRNGMKTCVFFFPSSLMRVFTIIITSEWHVHLDGSRRCAA